MINFKYVHFVNIILVLIGVVLIIAIVWIIKAYFQINTRQLKKADGYYVDQENLDAADNNTITESNNELSTLAFDGVNRNPEHNDKNLRKKNVMDSDRCY